MKQSKPLPKTARRSRRRLQQLVKQHVGLLNEILEHQIANLNGDYEFYKCYTYTGQKMPPWVKKAKRLVLLNDAGERIAADKK